MLRKFDKSKGHWYAIIAETSQVKVCNSASDKIYKSVVGQLLSTTKKSKMLVSL